MLQNSLSDFEIAIIVQLMLGKQVAEIAPALGVNSAKVAVFFKDLKKQLGARTAQQAVAIALLEGHISQEHPLIAEMLNARRRERLTRIA